MWGWREVGSSNLHNDMAYNPWSCAKCLYVCVCKLQHCIFLLSIRITIRFRKQTLHEPVHVLIRPQAMHQGKGHWVHGVGECTVEHCRKWLCVHVFMGSGSVLVCGSTKYVHHKVPPLGPSTNNMPVIIDACLMKSKIYTTTTPAPAPSNK